MIKNISTFILTIILTVPLFAQVGGYVEDFNDNNLDGWEVPTDAQRTFELQAVDSTLEIIYHRVASSWEWDNFNFTPAQLISADNNPYITLRAKSDVVTQLTLKPIYEAGTNDWLQVMLPADNQWHTYAFDLLAPVPRTMNRIYFYFDGGTTNPKSGTVYFDDLRIADSVRAADLLNISRLEQAIQDAHALYNHSVEGEAEGQFPIGSKQTLMDAITAAEAVFGQEDVTQQQIDDATWDLLDACSTFESNVIGPTLPLVDVNATIQTRYLYLNLDYLKDKGLLFGMQDATGYGVGWSGDDDRSDVKDVCGDYPALDSEEMYKVTRNLEPNRVRYRLISHYERGGVVSMCWHQYDPLGRGFYASDVNNENIVETILPGGKYHQQYKEKLRKVAMFFKGLRGPNGESVPVIFRPYHEHNGNWFWWGKGQCTPQEYIDLWRFTVTYLRDSLNVHNLLYVISPSLDRSNWGSNYKEIFPGNDYLDIYGLDHYFGDNITSSDKANFKEGLHRVAVQAREAGKLVALTEVGQEGLKTADFFTNVLLNAIVSDSVNLDYNYAAVWRNANVNHFFAPYPGQLSVPDFLKFYEDPYTFFASDLPDMYNPVVADTIPPAFVEYPASPFVATDTVFQISLKTNEKSRLKYDFSDLPFEAMVYDFEQGQGQFEHKTTLRGKQGDRFTVFVRAQDLFGNTTATSLAINVQIDTLQRILHWPDWQYDAGNWEEGQAAFAFVGQSEAQTSIPYSRAVYFRKSFDLQDPETYSMLAAIVTYDNGCALYLNGHEVERINLPADGALTYSTWALQNEASTKQIILDEEDLKFLRKGRNILGVEIHQAVDDSSDLKFDLKLLTSIYKVLIDYNENWHYYSEQKEPITQILEQVGIETFNLTPGKYYLEQNYPNPFNGQCRIRYGIPRKELVELTVFNVLGQKIKTLVHAVQNAGQYTVHFETAFLPSGIYFYQLSWGQKRLVRKMLLIR